MEATGTIGGETPTTDTTDTTDPAEGVVSSDQRESPAARPQPGMITRSYDAFCGIACLVAGGYLLGRAFGVINYPEVPSGWQ